MLTEKSFETLVSTHRRDLVKIASAIVGHADAEDVVQESALTLWQQRSKVPSEKARDWWVVITYSRAYNHLRKLPAGLTNPGGRPRGEVNLVDPEITLHAVGFPPPQGRSAELRDSLARLEMEELESVLLLAIHGSYRDIPPDKGEWRKHHANVTRARKKLAA